MNIRKKRYRVSAFFMVCILLCMIWMPAVYADEAEAVTMRLKQTEGTVTVKNKTGRTISTTDGSKLYEGYSIETGAASYAYISLDSDKAVKLDENSTVAINSSGKKLELSVSKGSLFFNVTAPLKEDETMNIRTSTMVTGIRGTSGYVQTSSDMVSSISVLEGTVAISVTDPYTGRAQEIPVSGGTNRHRILQMDCQQHPPCPD